MPLVGDLLRDFGLHCVWQINPSRGEGAVHAAGRYQSLQPMQQDPGHDVVRPPTMARIPPAVWIIRQSAGAVRTTTSLAKTMNLLGDTKL